MDGFTPLLLTLRIVEARGLPKEHGLFGGHAHTSYAAEIQCGSFVAKTPFSEGTEPQWGMLNEHIPCMSSDSAIITVIAGGHGLKGEHKLGTTRVQLLPMANGEVFDACVRTTSLTQRRRDSIRRLRKQLGRVARHPFSGLPMAPAGFLGSRHTGTQRAAGRGSILFAHWMLHSASLIRATAFAFSLAPPQLAAHPQ